MSAQRVFSGSPAEPLFGYCRAIRKGSLIFVSGTAAYDDQGHIVAPGDAYAQALRCFEIMRRAIDQLGGRMQDVVRTRIFVTDMAMAADIGRAHHATFGAHPPAATMVQITALIEPGLVVEIEADAVAGE